MMPVAVLVLPFNMDRHFRDTHTSHSLACKYLGNCKLVDRYQLVRYANICVCQLVDDSFRRSSIISLPDV
jgi:hypothetical protein